MGFNTQSGCGYIRGRNLQLLTFFIDHSVLFTNSLFLALWATTAVAAKIAKFNSVIPVIIVVIVCVLNCLM